MTFIERTMPPAQPVYVMAKPPRDVAHYIAQQRRLLRINGSYGAERFHVTLLPLGERGSLSPDDLALIERIIAASRIEPVDISFNRLRGNRLAGTGMRNVKGLQHTLVSCLGAGGVALPQYRFDPHLTLAYGVPPQQSASIAPIGWRIDALELIVSHHGFGRHETVCRWPLTTRQLVLPFTA